LPRYAPKERLPADLLHIPLRYASLCGNCSVKLPLGIRAHWSRSTRTVFCDDCVKREAYRVRSAAEQQSKRAPPPESNTHDSDRDPQTTGTDARKMPRQRTSWQQLCDYALWCVEAEAAASLVDFVQHGKRWFAHSGKEQLVTGLADSIAAPAGLGQELGKGKNPVIYGWPAVVVEGRDNKPKVAPLFAVQVQAERREDDTVTLHAVTEPEFNLAVPASGVFDPSAIEEIREFVLDGVPFGDAIAFEKLSRQSAKVLGLKIHSMPDAGELASSIKLEPGIHNAAISVLAEWSGYKSMLRRELVALKSRQDWQDTAAASLFSRNAGGNRNGSGPLAAPLPCNQSQEEVLEQMRADSLVVVTGPPGTGKTQLVVNAVANTWLEGGKVLVTSTNNKAVDVAVSRADRDVGAGLLIRTGNRDAREKVPDCITLAVEKAKQRNNGPARTRRRLRQAVKSRSELLIQLARLDQMDSSLSWSSEEREKLEQKARETSRQLWPDAGPPLPQINFAGIEQQCKRLLGAWFLRRWRSRRLRLRLRCQQDADLQVIAAWARTSRRIVKLRMELARGREERGRLAKELGDADERLRQADQRWSSASLDAIRAQTAAKIRAGAHALAGFAQSSARGNNLSRLIVNSMPHLRGWACTALTAQNNFPLESGLFDLVIIDDASQCSLAAILPLACRAKRLAIVGDPCQLNPIVSVGDGHLQKIARQAGFGNEQLRERGMHHKHGSAYAAFEHALKPARPAILDEHYRCHPHIARWFNRTFYANALTVLTDVSTAPSGDRAVGWIDVDGEAERPESGSWINRPEAGQAIRQLAAELQAGCRSVGVATPFQAQARLIQQLAKRRFGNEKLNEIGFMSGTAHRLQGDERDTIIFSAVLSPQMPINAIRWVEKERNLLNVAVSRARSRLVVMGHPRIDEFGCATLASLRIYVRQEVSNKKSRPAEFRTDSEPERLLLEALQDEGFKPYAKINVEGYELDFALLERGIKLNVEVDGDQHKDSRGMRRRKDIARDRVLTRSGWAVFRVPAWRCHEELGLIIDELARERNRISSHRR